MAHVEKVSIALTPEMAAAARSATDAGEYASTSEVVREAMRDWMRRRAERAQAIDELGALWDAGVSSGAPVDGEDAFARLRSRLDNYIAAREA
ncbi:ribbon-helix-helix domain-containing protein [Ancylobacter terrae]|uniref:ribbon-helix-helix domain-containing protein n=1 Tax=Ancylobacter sp. sgz301288 TaxID=3342077 RepID=UPI00385FE93B